MELTEASRRLNAILESIKPELRGQGIVLISTDGVSGKIHCSSTIQNNVAAGMLRHIAMHLDGTCTTCE